MTEKDRGQQRPDQEAAEFLREHYPGGVPDGPFQALVDIQHQGAIADFSLYPNENGRRKRRSERGKASGAF